MSYRQKHNEPNGQNNHDGAGENFSENYGAEWETTDPQIGSIRTHQIKSFLLTLFISRGVPMLLGDECRRTQGGNNNAYCQAGLTGAFLNSTRRCTDSPWYDRLSPSPSDAEYGALLYGYRAPLVQPARGLAALD